MGNFCFEFFDIFIYIKNAFQIKGACEPESKKNPLPIKTFKFVFDCNILWERWSTHLEFQMWPCIECLTRFEQLVQQDYQGSTGVHHHQYVNK
jgi:hypothetical protein